jgi:hypothetical protein
VASVNFWDIVSLQLAVQHARTWTHITLLSIETGRMGPVSSFPVTVVTTHVPPFLLTIDKLFPPAKLTLAPRVRARGTPSPSSRPPDGDWPHGEHYIDSGRWARWATPPRTTEPEILGLTPPTSELGGLDLKRLFCSGMG